MYNAVKDMDDKGTTVKNLSWQDGFVSSVNGVTIAGTVEIKPENLERKNQQQRGQKENSDGKAQSKDKNHQQYSPKRKSQEELKLEEQHQTSQEEQPGQSTMNNHQKSPSKQPTVSILKPTTPCSTSEIEAISAMSQRYQPMSPKTYGTDRQMSSLNNKENTSTTTASSDIRDKPPSSSYTSTTGLITGDGESSANRMSLFEEEYQRKIQLMRSSAKKKEDKLFVLLNRNAGVITHVIRTNPKYLRK